MKTLSACIILLIAMVNCSTPNKDKNVTGKNNLPDASINNLTEIYWKLTELNGKAVSQYRPSNREPYLLLRKEDNRVEGTGGCNAMGGQYILAGNHKITFSQLFATEMACPEMTIETDFHTALEKVKAYDSNGSTLILLGEDNSPIAKFEASERK